MSEGRRQSKRSLVKESPAEYVTAANFKATCLELMDHVNVKGVEYVITKHGKPVAKLVPADRPGKSRFLGSMKGSVLKYERPFDPIGGEYDIDR